jgi:hypothetical protein
MKKLKLFGMLFAFVALFASCDENQTISIPLDKVSFEIPLELDGQPTLRSTSTDESYILSFSGIFEGLSLNADLFDGIRDYVDANEQIKLVLKKVELLVTPHAIVEYSIQSFTSTASVVGSNEEYTFSTENLNVNEAMVNDAELTTYLNQILTAIQNGKTLDIKVSGTVENYSQTVPTVAPITQIGFAKFILDLVAEIKLNIVE